MSRVTWTSISRTASGRLVEAYGESYAGGVPPSAGDGGALSREKVCSVGGPRQPPHPHQANSPKSIRTNSSLTDFAPASESSSR